MISFARERPLSPSWLRLACISALGLVLTMALWPVLFRHYPGSGGGDGVFFFRMIEAGKVSLLRWHELPLWNPYECGGVPLWDNPQSIAASPLVLLLTSASTAATIGAWIILHVTAGFVGLWLLSRSELGLSRGAAFVASCLFAFGLPISNHLGGGHTAFAGFVYSPLALLFWRRAEVDVRYAVGLGLLVALMFYEGGVYAPALIALMLAAETLTRLSSVRRALHVFRAGVVVVVVAGCVAAARLLPVIDQIAHYKRQLDAETDFVDWQMLKDMYLDRWHALHTPPHAYVWGEYVAYIGVIVLVFAMAGLLLSITRETWFFVTALIVFALMLGNFAHLAPWTLLRTYVPPFPSLRVPSRFRLLFVMFIAGYAGIAVDRLPIFLVRIFGSRPLTRAAGVAIACVALFGAGDVASHAVDVINTQWDGPLPGAVTPSAQLFLGGPGIAQFIDQPRQNRGRLECWEEWAPHAGAPLWTGNVPQARSEGDKAHIENVSRTQNSFTIEVRADEPTTILLNTSFARGWRTSVGRTRAQNHELVVDVPAGHHTVRVWYWPVGLTAGFWVTGVSLALSLIALIALARLPQGPTQVSRRVADW
ncbi:MAG: hypothetical protein FWD73_01410 [Polyangiaceae bacterium]|nr:hypothetical protein [Polyangiaceae bacterium]